MIQGEAAASAVVRSHGPKQKTGTAMATGVLAGPVPEVQAELGMTPLLQLTLSDNTRITFGQLAALV
jgi:hypothetical protein